MTISAASLSAALHGIGHHHPRPSATKAQPFAQLVAAAQSSGNDATQTKPTDSPGALLSADLLQAVQSIK